MVDARGARLWSFRCDFVNLCAETLIYDAFERNLMNSHLNEAKRTRPRVEG
jgi:hypothetical protein